MSRQLDDAFQGPEMVPTSHCDSSSFTDGYGLAIQAVLAGLAFASLVIKRLYFEPQRRTWTVWFFDTSKQGVGAGVIHFLNVFLAQILQQKQGDPCTWYVVSFLLDSTLGLLIIYSGVRVATHIAAWKDWPTLRFGEYGKPPSCHAWAHQCAVFLGIIVFEKIVITVMLEFQFWRHIREIILSPITNPKLELTIVMLIIPFLVNTLIFWMVDSFTMRIVTPASIHGDDDSVEAGSISKAKYGRKNGMGQSVMRTYVNEGDDDYDDSGCVDRLLANEDDVFAESLEVNSALVAKENDGLLSRRESNVHLRLNSGSLL